MEQSKTSSKLFTITAIERREELDEKYERCHSIVESICCGLSEKEVHDALTNFVSKTPENHEDVCLGLLVIILTDSHNANKAYRDLTLVSRDGLQLVITQINQLSLDKYTRLLDSVRQQLLWLVREFVKNNVTQTETLCWNLLRQVAGGDLTPKNLWLVENLLDLFSDCRSWLEKHSSLLCSVVYTYLRLIEDHYAPNMAQLRQKEVTFTAQLLRDKFSECIQIGRDLVRLLQNVARIPEFEKLWRDMLHNPTTLSQNFTGITQILQRRTSKHYLLSRLTPDMERKIGYLTSHVRFGQQKRYQDWFQRQYLSTQEAQTLRCDVIRFIVGVIHPSNEILCSDIIPRWAVIGWLLTTCTSNTAASNAKLALFYDWLFYEPEKDNIMNIEPAILVMHHSMRTHPAITATLLDFLCRIIPNFYPPLTEQVQSGIHNSLMQILDKRVLPSLAPLFDNPRLDKELRAMVKENFFDFCTSEGVRDGRDEDGDLDIKNNVSDGEAVFSDDEDDISPAINLNSQGLVGKFEKKEETKEIIHKKDIMDSLDMKYDFIKSDTSLPFDCGDVIDDELLNYLKLLWSDRDNEERQCESMEKLIQYVITERVQGEIAVTLARCILRILKDHFISTLLPNKLDSESLEDSLGKPLFVAFRELSQIVENDMNRKPLFNLLREMSLQQPYMGFHLLYFLGVSGQRSEVNSDMYKEFCLEKNGDFDKKLAHDMELCQECEGDLFLWLLPEVYSIYPEGAIGNMRLLHLIVSYVDASQLHSILCRISTGSLVMFRKDSFLDVLKASLEWETWEQVCVWQLVMAHSIPVEYMLPLLPKLHYPQHSEALSALLLLLRQEKPSSELLRQLLSRDSKNNDSLVAACLNHWAKEHEDTLAQLLSNHIKQHSGATTQGKRKRGQTQKASAQLEVTLGHLNNFRISCRQTSFLNMDNVHSALQIAQNVSSEALKKRFNDLFALLDDVVEIKSPNKRNKKVVKSGRRGVHNSSDSSTEEEEIVKPKPSSKKRKKPNPVPSDSD